MLQEIDQDIWVVEQPFRYFGISIGTRMTVIRLADQALLVISPVQLTSAIARQLNGLGAVKHIVAPNLYHYLFAASFKQAYPEATFWATSELGLKRPDLPIDQTICDPVSPTWQGVEQIYFDGFRTVGLGGFDALNEWVFFHPSSRTLILTDAAFHFDQSFPVITQIATRLIGSYESLSPSLLEKVATTEKDKVKRAVEKVLVWDFERVIMAHGSLVVQAGKTQFRQGYEQFLGQSLEPAA